MPEPISTIGLYCLTYATLERYARCGSAISAEAQDAQSAATAVVASVEQSQFLFGKKSAAIAQLLDMAYECREVDWNGEGALAISPTAVFIAKAFVRLLPDDIPLPEFAPEPDGCVSMDWIQSRNRLFSLSVGTNHRIAYTWLDGTDKGHAVARFDEEEIPPRILEGIRGIADHGKSTIGAF